MKWMAFAIATALALATIFYLPRLQRRIPPIPRDDMHQVITKIDQCIQCHGESGSHPLPQAHAARDRCLFCHQMEK